MLDGRNLETPNGNTMERREASSEYINMELVSTCFCYSDISRPPLSVLSATLLFLLFNDHPH